MWFAKHVTNISHHSKNKILLSATLECSYYRVFVDLLFFNLQCIYGYFIMLHIENSVLRKPIKIPRNCTLIDVPVLAS